MCYLQFVVLEGNRGEVLKAFYTPGLEIVLMQLVTSCLDALNHNKQELKE